MSGPGGAGVVQVFSAHAADYDGLRRRLVPDYDGFYGAVVEALERVVPGEIRRVLDLGAGTGLLSAVVAEALPEAQIELLDASEPMLALAQQRLGDTVSAVHVADMAGALPEGPFDAVVSALAIHHLEHADKRALMRRIHAALRPAACSPTPSRWTRPPRSSARSTRSDGPTTAGRSVPPRRRSTAHASACATTAAPTSRRQLGWLRDAGFATADCTYKSWRFAVLIAQKES